MFSIRTILAGILFIGVLIQLTQAIINREELILLEAMAAHERDENKKQHLRAEAQQRKWDVCKKALEDSLLPLEGYLAARKRFDRLPSSRVSD